MKKAIAILSISALALASCGKKDCDAYGKSKNYKKTGAKITHQTSVRSV